MSGYAPEALVNAWTWMILALVLAGLEMLLPGAFMIWLSGAAVLTAVTAALLGIGWQWQLVAFALFALVLVLASRRFARPGLRASDDPALNDRRARLVGETVVVTAPIAAGRGRVRLGDSEWAAEGPDAPAGTVLRVTALRGTVLVVG